MDAAQSDLERFALRVYAADGVPAACLHLQESAHIDVNLVLFGAFVGARGDTLTPIHAQQAARRVGEWHSEVVLPLRAIRRRLKSGPAPAPDERTSRLRGDIQSIEIEAELIELAELDALGSTLDREHGSGDTVARTVAAISVVVRAATGRHPDAGEQAAIEVIGRAVGTLHGDSTDGDNDDADSADGDPTEEST